MIASDGMQFGETEQLTRSRDRAKGSAAKLGLFLGSHPDLRGVVLTGPGPVAWATGGSSRPVDRAASVDLLWVVVTSDTAVLVTTEVEHDRVRDECDPAALGFELVAVPWFDEPAFVRAAQDAAGSPAAMLGSDGHAAFGVDVTDDLISLRMALSAPERDELRSLGAATAEVLESALRGWIPGERDVDLQARVASGLEAAGADAPVLIVGGDDRVERYRHPMAIGRPVERLAMTVTVARRAGLHAAATRFACAGRLDDDLSALRSRVLHVEEAVLASSKVGATYGQVLESLDRAYIAVGTPEAWRGHYQGGPIGFAQREFEIAPCQRDSRWFDEPVALGHAVAWNPSLAGGVKVEDTYLVGEEGLERVTETDGWPTEPNDPLGRPAVLQEVG
jgi:Xaa-Pro aminopeptidase